MKTAPNQPETKTTKPLFPVLIDLSGQNVLVMAGSGQEEVLAVEYLRALAPCVHLLLVLSPSPSEELRSAADETGACLLEKTYERTDLYGADLVVCTMTDPVILDDVFAACRTLGIRLQITSQPQRSDYILQLKK